MDTQEQQFFETDANVKVFLKDAKKMLDENESLAGLEFTLETLLDELGTIDTIDKTQRKIIQVLLKEKKCMRAKEIERENQIKAAEKEDAAEKREALEIWHERSPNDPKRRYIGEHVLEMLRDALPETRHRDMLDRVDVDRDPDSKISCVIAHFSVYQLGPIQCSICISASEKNNLYILITWEGESQEDEERYRKFLVTLKEAMAKEMPHCCEEGYPDISIQEEAPPDEGIGIHFGIRTNRELQNILDLLSQIFDSAEKKA